MTRGRRQAAALLAALLLALPLTAAAADPPLAVTWHPTRAHPGDVAWVHVRGASEAATVEGSLGPRTLVFFPYASGQAAVVGVDVESKAGPQPWRLAVVEPGRDPRTLSGRLTIHKREFPVQRLTLPPGMVDLDPETERRAVAEGERLATLYRTVTPERLWRGPFVRPVAGQEPPTGPDHYDVVFTFQHGRLVDASPGLRKLRNSQPYHRTSSGLAVPVPLFIMVMDATRLPKRAASMGLPVTFRVRAAPAEKLSPAPQMSTGCWMLSVGTKAEPVAVTTSAPSAPYVTISAGAFKRQRSSA